MDSLENLATIRAILKGLEKLNDPADLRYVASKTEARLEQVGGEVPATDAQGLTEDDWKPGGTD